ncbi:heterokaryon incompatibility protein [Botrytis cinerea]
MNLRSTDPRDKIYGILGLLNEKARAAIPIDYHKQPEWTFVPTMAYIIQHEPKGLALLGLLWRTRHFKTPLPSWVPDFTISADFNDQHNPVFLRGSCVNHDWEWPEDLRATVSSDRNKLHAFMANFGRVTHIVSFIDGDRDYYVSRFKEIETLLTVQAPRSEPFGAHLLDGEAQKMFQDAILPIFRKRKFFVTDKGFAGVATPMIRDGDTIAIIAGWVGQQYLEILILRN